MKHILYHSQTNKTVRFDFSGRQSRYPKHPHPRRDVTTIFVLALSLINLHWWVHFREPPVCWEPVSSQLWKNPIILYSTLQRGTLTVKLNPSSLISSIIRRSCYKKKWYFFRVTTKRSFKGYLKATDVLTIKRERKKLWTWSC